jgi:hypothetical protein
MITIQSDCLGKPADWNQYNPATSKSQKRIYPVCIYSWGHLGQVQDHAKQFGQVIFACPNCHGALQLYEMGDQTAGAAS